MADTDTMRIDLEWKGGSGYSVATPSGATLALDSTAKAGASPMETLLAALAGCMAIDVVLILKRMRNSPDRLLASVRGARADDHPRRFVRIRLDFTAVGGATTPDRLERSVQLSFDKYCSVLHSLAPDTAFRWSARITTDPSASGEGA